MPRLARRSKLERERDKRLGRPTRTSAVFLRDDRMVAAAEINEGVRLSEFLNELGKLGIVTRAQHVHIWPVGLSDEDLEELRAVVDATGNVITLEEVPT